MSRESYLVGVDVLAGRSLRAEDVSDVDEPEVRPELQVVEAAPRPYGGRALTSEIPGVSDEDWTRFVVVMKTQSPRSVSASNELGMFAMRVKRLADLGLVKNLKSARAPTGRMTWFGDWVAPLTQDAFLGDPRIQYRVFAASMRCYADGLSDGDIECPDDLPSDMSLSGMLAILHRCGPHGLKSWSDKSKRFEQTTDLFEAANGIF